MPFLVALAIFSGLNPSYAGLDFDINASGRTYPEGGSLNVSSGYGLVAWGSAPSGKGGSSDFMYGYIRPSLNASLAGSYNQGDVRFDIFPISILGVSFGSTMTGNYKDYAAYDCETYRCQGEWTSQYARLQAIVGYGDLFFVLSGRLEDWYHWNLGDKDFIEPESGLLGHRGRDRFITYRLIAGAQIDSDLQVLTLFNTARSERAEHQANTGMIMMQYKWDEEFSIGGGVGVFSSDLREQSPTLALRLSWTPLPSVSLN